MIHYERCIISDLFSVYVAVIRLLVEEAILLLTQYCRCFRERFVIIIIAVIPHQWFGNSPWMRSTMLSFLVLVLRYVYFQVHRNAAMEIRNRVISYGPCVTHCVVWGEG